MTFDRTCRTCRLARNLSRAAAAFVALGMPLFAARETGWLQEDPPPKTHYAMAVVNTPVFASGTATRGEDDGRFPDWMWIQIDQVPDQ